MNTASHTIHDDIARWLKANERSASWLAKKCDVHPTYIAMIANHKRTPSPQLEERIRDVMQQSA